MPLDNNHNNNNNTTTDNKMEDLDAEVCETLRIR